MKIILLLITVLLLLSNPSSNFAANNMIAYVHVERVIPPAEKKSKKKKLAKSKKQFRKASKKKQRWHVKTEHQLNNSGLSILFTILGALSSIALVFFLFFVVFYSNGLTSLIALIAIITSILLSMIILLIFFGVKYSKDNNTTWKSLHGVKKTDARYKYDEEVWNNYPYLPEDLASPYVHSKLHEKKMEILLHLENKKKRPSARKIDKYSSSKKYAEQKTHAIDCLYKELDIIYQKIKKSPPKNRKKCLVFLYKIGKLSIKKINIEMTHKKSSKHIYILGGLSAKKEHPNKKIDNIDNSIDQLKKELNDLLVY